jgi:hypothetical protein
MDPDPGGPKTSGSGFRKPKNIWIQGGGIQEAQKHMDPDSGGPKTYRTVPMDPDPQHLKKSVSGLRCQAGRRGYPGWAGGRCDGGRGGHRHQHAGRFRREPRRFFRHRSRRNLAVQPIARKVWMNICDTNYVAFALMPNFKEILCDFLPFLILSVTWRIFVTNKCFCI